MFADHDGFAELLVPSLDVIKRMAADPFYQETVWPDESNFLDHERSKITIGYLQVHVRDGRAV